VSTSRRAFYQLIKTNWRELFRDKKTAFFVVVFPLFFVATYLGMSVLVAGGSYHIGVAPGRYQHELVTDLNRVTGFTVTALHTSPPALPSALDGYDALVQASSGHGVVTLAADKFGALRGLQSAMSAAGFGGNSAVFRTPDGGVPFSPVKSSLPTVLLMALMSLAFFGTAAPMITLRQSGTLRMLGTTPLARRTFLLAQLTVRLGLAVGQLAVLILVALGVGFVTLGGAVEVFFTGLLGATMFFGLGYLVAARMRSAEVANGLLAMMMPVVLMFSGLFLPLDLMPAAMRAIANVVPTTYLVDALGHDITGAASAHGVGLDWLILAGSAMVFAVLATRLFRWDTGENR
jgi:ABC-2 type transport system permease protein